jgi:hypothetical protein
MVFDWPTASNSWKQKYSSEIEVLQDTALSKCAILIRCGISLGFVERSRDDYINIV